MDTLPVQISVAGNAKRAAPPNETVFFHCTPKEPAGRATLTADGPTVVTYVDPTKGTVGDLEEKHHRFHNNTWVEFATHLFKERFEYDTDTATNVTTI